MLPQRLVHACVYGVLQEQAIAVLKALPNAEARFDCPQAFLSLGFYTRMDVPEAN